MTVWSEKCLQGQISSGREDIIGPVRLIRRIQERYQAGERANEWLLGIKNGTNAVQDIVSNYILILNQRYERNSMDFIMDS